MASTTRFVDWVCNALCRDARGLPRDAAGGGKPISVITLRGNLIARIWPRSRAARKRVGQSWEEALSPLGIDIDAVSENVVSLADHGEPFRCCASSDRFGPVLLTGWTEGLEARIAMSYCTPLERDLQAALQRSRAALGALREAGLRADSSPVPAIETDPQGNIVWHNPAAERLLRQGVNRVSLSQIEPGVRGARMQLLGSDGQACGWARATTALVPGGGKIIHLENIDEQIQAETDLESFMATLTETFAHLEQGLGIFNRDGKLTLFNPALAQMFSLDPALLARRPSLRHFLEALRQRRMMPEQRDYTAWRTRFIDEASATDGAPYTEDWPLPSGRTLRVSARRHPRGALAFIFKDISSQVMLESRYRAEIETTQATLEKLAEAVAVFGASGQITYANPAFSRIIGTDPMDELTSPTIDTVCDTCRADFGDPGLWDELKRYILSSERAGAWHGLDQFRSGGQVMLRACALPDGSTLLTLDGTSEDFGAGREARYARA